MKFLCDQCKAKYQISDEKVAGKTVRMKCRKCGHMIEVRANVTDTSVSRDMPREEGASGSDVAPRTARLNTSEPPTRGHSKAPLATSLASARPMQPRTNAPRPPNSASMRQEGALAGAFQRQVQREREDEGALDMRELSAGDEWYVAINGVPVGPIRMGELRRKAASGAVTEDSLVWQDGLEEWRPVRAISELATIVREVGTGGGRPSLATPPMEAAKPPSVPPPQPASRTNPSMRQPFGAPRLTSTAPARNNVVPLRSSPSHAAVGYATAERLEEDPTVHDATPFVEPPAPVPHAPPVPSAYTPPPMAAADPFGAMRASHAPSAYGTLPGSAGNALSASGAMAPALPRRGPPWMAIAMIVVAGTFGVTAALLLFQRDHQPPPNVVVQLPPTATPTAATAAPTADPNQNVATSIEMDDGPHPDGGRPHASSGSNGRVAANNAAPTPAASGKPTNNPAIGDLLKGIGDGPAPGGGPGGPAPSGGGGGLTEAEISRIVSSRTPSLRRSCTDGLELQKQKITVNLHIGGDGHVSNATASPSGPGASCLEQKSGNWVFPASGGGTDVAVPFQFLSQ